MPESYGFTINDPDPEPVIRFDSRTTNPYDYRTWRFSSSGSGSYVGVKPKVISPNDAFKGKFFKARTEADATLILEIFKTVGIDTEGLTNRYTEEAGRLDHYYGELNGSFVVWSLSNFESFSRNHNIEILKLPELEDFNNTINCETEELNNLFALLADNFGLRWGSGNRYTDLNYWNEHGFEITYEPRIGCVSDKHKYEDKGFKVVSLFEALFGENKNSSKNSYTNRIKIEDLKLNGLYTAMLSVSCYSVLGQVRMTFKYNGSISRDQMTESTDKNIFWKNVFSNKEVIILPADKFHRKSFRLAHRKFKIEEREGRAAERFNTLRRRRARRENPLEYIKRNEDLDTQLLSASLYSILFLFKDNPVAASLIRLNSLGYLGKSIRNITIRSGDKKMTYCPAGKASIINCNGKWDSKGRQSGKYGKIIRSIIKQQVPRLKFKDQDIEQLVNHIKSEVAEGVFEVVEGDSIRDWYSGDRYTNDVDTGTLEHSCMRGDEAYDWLEIYSVNPEVVKMVILHKKGKLIGRALLWEGKWMDRVYASDSITKSFIKWAKENNYNYKDAQNTGCVTHWRTPEGAYFEEVIRIKLNTQVDYFPYADTFYYIDVENGIMSNSYLEGGTQMRETDGLLEDGTSDRTYDDIDERYILSEDAVYIEERDITTHVNNAGCCYWEDTWHHQDDMVTTHDGRTVYEDHNELIHTEDGYAKDEETFFCDYNEERYIEDITGSVYLEELEITVNSNNVTDAYEENNYHYHEDEWQSKEDLESQGLELTISG